MFYRFLGLGCIVALAALGGYAQTGSGQAVSKPRAHSANMQAPSGYLGVGVQDLDAERVKALNLKDSSGVVVTQVTPNEAGARAGIHVNDVILEINGQKVDSSEQFSGSIIGKAPGTKVSLTVARNGAKESMVATLGLRPPDLPLIGAVQPAAQETSDGMVTIAGDAPQVGFVGEPLGPQLAEYFGVREGVLVQMVYEKTPAERAGLKAGDVVTRINGMPVASPREISGIVRQAKKVVVFTIVRNKKEMTLNVEMAWVRYDLMERDPVN